MSYQDIQPDQVDELLAGGDVVVIDMRDADSRAKGEFPKAVGHSEDVIQGLVRRRRSDPTVLVYCYHGNQSRDLCNFLGQFGLNSLYNLEGGWLAWQNWQAKRLGMPGVVNNWLLSNGFDPNNLNSRVHAGMSALMLAALQGKHDVVDALLAAGADLRAANDDEHSALWFACVNGDVAMVRKLIVHGSDIDHRNVNGVTCSVYAASTGKLDVLQVLAAAGADLTIRTHDGYDALESSSTVSVLKFLKSLVRDSASDDARQMPAGNAAMAQESIA